MKELFGWTQHKKLIIITVLLAFFSSSCIKQCDALDRLTEGYDARSAMRSTVKIHSVLIGKRKNIISLSDKQPDGTEIKMEWTGSGVVVKNDDVRKQSLILSVYHVTHSEPSILSMDQDGIFLIDMIKMELKVETLDGTICEAGSMAGNFKQDLSVIRSLCIAGEATSLADELPPVGASVMVSGAALGVHPKGIFIVTDGRFMGIDEASGEEIITLPSAPGHSGSGIFYKGKIIGLLSKRTVDYEHISLCVSLENAKTILELAERIWLLETINLPNK